MALACYVIVSFGGVMALRSASASFSAQALQSKRNPQRLHLHSPCVCTIRPFKVVECRKPTHWPYAKENTIPSIFSHLDLPGTLAM